MHFEPDTEWCADAGGVMEISRWAGLLPCSGASVKRLSVIVAQTRALHRSATTFERSLHRWLMSNVPLGQTSPIARKVHDTL